MLKKILWTITILAIIAVLAGGIYYLYLNVFNNQYEFTYDLLRRKDWDPYTRTYKFTARNDSDAAERAIFKLGLDFDFDNNSSLDDSNYRYRYNNLRLENVTKRTLVRVPAKFVEEFFLGENAIKIYRLDEREVDWRMFTDSIPYFNYSMTVYLENPYEEKDLKFISHSDYTAANKAIDTLAYCISHYWYNENRPIEDVLVVNNVTLNFVHSLNNWYVWYRLTSSPYCKGFNMKRYSIRYKGLVDE